MILFNFANYSPSIAMKLKAKKCVTNKYVSGALFLKLQAAGVNFEKPLG